MTKFEQLGGLKAKKLAELQQTEKSLAEVEEKIKGAVLNGDEKKKAELIAERERLRKAIEQLQGEIPVIESKQAKYELEHLEEKIKELEKERQAVEKQAQPEISKLKAKVEKLEQAYKAALAELGRKQAEVERKTNSIDQQIATFRQRLDELKPEKEPKHSVEEYLQMYRDGKGPALINEDKNAEQAYRLYEREREEILAWVHQAQTLKMGTGGLPPKPECMKFYSKDRLETIIYNATLRKDLARLVKNF